MRNRLLKSFALFVLLAIVFASYADNDNGDVVDLGLPSGVKWATCNVGATNPWDYGNYYAWGETDVKDDYSWETYKYCKGSYKTLTKYCFIDEWGNGGFTDTLTTLEAADDVATAVLGSDYSMPTAADWEELSRECYWVWTTNYNNQNVSGCIVYKAKSADDKGTKMYVSGTPSAPYFLSDPHVFLPAAGYYGNADNYDAGSSGFYWSASLFEYGPFNARFCVFNNNREVDSSNAYYRFCGLSVRPVQRK